MCGPFLSPLKFNINLTVLLGSESDITIFTDNEAIMPIKISTVTFSHLSALISINADSLMLRDL